MISDEQRGSAPGASGAPVAMRIKLRYRSVDEFVDEFAKNINRKGLFLASPRPRPVGTELLVDLRLADDEPVVSCRGVVRWIRGSGGAGGNGLSGMGIEILEADEETRQVLQRVELARTDLALGDNDAIPGSPPGWQPAGRNGRRPALSAAALLARASAEVSRATGTTSDGDDDLARLLGDDGSGSESDAILSRAKKLAASLAGDGGAVSDIAELKALSPPGNGGDGSTGALSSADVASELAALLGRAPVTPRRHRAPARVELPPAASPGRPAPDRRVRSRQGPARPTASRPAASSPAGTPRQSPPSRRPVAARVTPSRPSAAPSRKPATPSRPAVTRPAPTPPSAAPADAPPPVSSGRSETIVDSGPEIPVPPGDVGTEAGFLEHATVVADRPEEFARAVDRIGQRIEQRAEQQAAAPAGGEDGPGRLRLEPTEEELEEQLEQAQLVLEAALDDLAGSIEPSEEIVIGDDEEIVIGDELDVGPNMIVESEEAVAAPEPAEFVGSVPVTDPMGPDPDRTLMGQPVAPLPAAAQPYDDRAMLATPISGPPRVGKSAADDIETAEKAVDLEKLFAEAEAEGGLEAPLQEPALHGAFDEDEFDEQPTALVDRADAVIASLTAEAAHFAARSSAGAGDGAAIVREAVFDSVMSSQEARREEERAAAVRARADSASDGLDALVDSLSRNLHADALDADDLMASDLDALARSNPGMARFGDRDLAMEPGDTGDIEEYTLEPTSPPFEVANDGHLVPLGSNDGIFGPADMHARAFTEAEAVSMDASDSIMDVLDQLDPFADGPASVPGVATRDPLLGVDAALESLEDDNEQAVELDMDEDIELLDDADLIDDSEFIAADPPYDPDASRPHASPLLHPTPPPQTPRPQRISSPPPHTPRPQRISSPPPHTPPPQHASGPIAQLTPPPELETDDAVPEPIDPESSGGQSGKRKRGFFRRIFNKEDG